MLLDAIGQRARLVNFIYRNNDRHFRRMSVINGFESLRHDAIISGDDQHNDIGGFGSARTHAGKGFVTGRVEKDNLAAIRRRLLVLNRDFIRADMLRDSTSFASGDIGGANRIQQSGLAVINVAHDGDNGRTRHAFALRLLPPQRRRKLLSRLALRR